jgi:hypothetical protein
LSAFDKEAACRLLRMAGRMARDLRVAKLGQVENNNGINVQLGNGEG